LISALLSVEKPADPEPFPHFAISCVPQGFSKNENYLR